MILTWFDTKIHIWRVRCKGCCFMLQWILFSAGCLKGTSSRDRFLIKKQVILTVTVYFSSCCFWHAVIILNTRCLQGVTIQCKPSLPSSLQHCVFCPHLWLTQRWCNTVGQRNFENKDAHAIESTLAVVQDLLRLHHTVPIQRRLSVSLKFCSVQMAPFSCVPFVSNNCGKGWCKTLQSLIVEDVVCGVFNICAKLFKSLC